jgi:hypothetical protein
MFVIDAALADELVLEPIGSMASTRSLRTLRLYEVVKDDRVPVLLRELSSPTFITNDEAGFWNRHLCSKAYCILYFALTDYQQEQIPSLLRRLLRLPEFKTKAGRMGKVVRVSLAN